jgi:hypothetical protein
MAARPAPQGANCKACKRPIDWRNIRTMDREIRPRIFERMYYCPHCRAVLEFASWQGREPW